MAKNTKEAIITYLVDLSESFEFTIVERFTASAISEELFISRSLASQYLNEAAREGLLIKANSRPVYFFPKKQLEAIYNIKFEDDEFYDLDELKDYISEHGDYEDDYPSIVGAGKSLTTIIKQAAKAFEYPPDGLPMIIHGDKGTGKRTISRAIFDNAARKGIIHQDTQYIKFEFTPLNSAFIATKVFGDDEEEGLISKHDHLVLVFSNAQYMAEPFQARLAELIETMRPIDHAKAKVKKSIRIIILAEGNPQIILEDNLLKNIPVIIKTMDLSEKSREEIEELIFFFIDQEMKRMHKNVKISSSVLRALISGHYDQNLIDLKATVQLMCASALKEATGDVITIHTYDLPEYLLQTMPIVTDEDVVYIDAWTYKKSNEIDFILDYYDRIFLPFSKDMDHEWMFLEAKEEFDLLGEYLSFKQRIPPTAIQGLESSLNNIIDIVIKKRYINLPSGLVTTLAKLMYIAENYHLSIQTWQQNNRELIYKADRIIREHLAGEVDIVDEIAKIIGTNLELSIDEVISTMMVISLHHYNTSVASRSVFGLIACHGYATATSIAEAANALLNSYVFEAVDMPLDVEIAEIKETIIEKLDRMRHKTDVIIMVDMGSLEQIGNSLNTAINCNVGIINNVSTRMAVEVGNAIINGHDIEMILHKIASGFKISYTFVDRKKGDMILFTSETGPHMASRMRDLFARSLPGHAPLALEVADFNQLITNGPSSEVLSKNHVLFITGTSDPHIEGYTFVALEDIIAGNDIDVILSRLSPYFTEHDLDRMFTDLRKNFTLQNVIQYLTILNPQVLLDNVTSAVDDLQMSLERRFSGKTLIGIYIHVCCLIERLVTKSEITEFVDLANFEEDHKDFIDCVREAFMTLSSTYNIVISNSEIAYLYNFIANDGDGSVRP